MISNTDKKLYDLGHTQKDLFITELYNTEEIVEGFMCIEGSCYFDISNCFDADALEKAFFEVLRRNDAFRMRLVKGGFWPKQYFQEVSEFPRPERIEYPGTVEELKEYFKNPEYKRIPMWNPQLTIAEIYRCTDGNGALILWQHHICTDGYSAGIVAYDQLCEFYDCYKKGETPPEPKKMFSFADFLEYENKKNHQKRFKSFIWRWKEASRHFWKYRVPVKPPKNVRDNIHDRIGLGTEMSGAIDVFCKKYNCSDSVFFLSAVAILVNKTCGAERLLFSTESHCRATFAQKKTCGAILDSIDLFLEIDYSLTVTDYIKRYSKKLIEASMNLKFIYLFVLCTFNVLNYISSGIGPQGDTWFCFNNQRGYEASADRSLEYVDMVQQGAADALGMDLFQYGQEIIIDFIYEPQVMTGEKAKVLEDAYLKLLRYILDNPSSTLKECLDSISFGL